MSWADRLLRRASGSSAAAPLATWQQQCLARGTRLVTIADQAPPAADAPLRELAERQVHLAATLAAALHERGAPAHAAAAVESPVAAAPNHWARLVAELDEARGTEAEVARAAPALLAIDPQLAPVLEALSAGLRAHRAALRELIARADPQALN
jgi:hypothetical protein